MAHMVIPTRVSRTLQDDFFVNKGASIFPPRLREKNQTKEARTAPAPKKRWPGCLNWLEMLPSKITVSRYTWGLSNVTPRVVRIAVFKEDSAFWFAERLPPPDSRPERSDSVDKKKTRPANACDQ